MSQPADSRFDRFFQRAAELSARRLPHGFARRFGAALGGVGAALLADRRRRAERRLAAAFPERGAGFRRQSADAACRQLGAAIFDAASRRRFGRVELCRRLTLDGWQHLDAAPDVTVVTAARFGFWQLAILPLVLYRGVDRGGRPPGSVDLAGVPPGSDLSWLESFAGSPSAGSPSAGISALVVDPRSADAGAPFLGRPSILEPPLVERLTGVPLVLALAAPAPAGGYRVSFGPPLARAGVPAAERRLLEALEREVRARPELWLWG